MAKKSQRLNDFRSGEMTPGLGTRSDLEAYSKGCILMKNCMPLVEGGVERVPGTRFLRTVKQTEEGWGLRITRSGSGSGDVDSNPLGIDCGPTCYTFFADGASIGLTAEAEPDSQFVGWSGDGTGSPIRTVVMNGNKVVNAAFVRLGSLYQHFPLDMVNDETYLYLCGRATIGRDYQCYVEKRPISNPPTLTKAVYFSGDALLIEYFEDICIDDDYVYVCGRGYNTTTSQIRGIVRCYLKSDFSLQWTYWIPVVGSGQSSFHAIYQTGNWVFALGVDGAATAYLTKLNKSGGSYVGKVAITNFSSTAAWGGISYDDGYIYMSSEWAGHLAMAKVRASDLGGYFGAITGFSYFYRNVIVGNSVYGVGAVLGADQQLRTQARALSNLAVAVWDRTQNYKVGQYETFYDIVSDGTYLYAVGIFYDVAISKYRGLSQCIELDGSAAVWTQESDVGRYGQFQGPLIIDGYLWLCLYSNNSSTIKSWVEKRDLLDGHLVQEWELY